MKLPRHIRNLIKLIVLFTGMLALPMPTTGKWLLGTSSLKADTINNRIDDDVTQIKIQQGYSLIVSLAIDEGYYNFSDRRSGSGNLRLNQYQHALISQHNWKLCKWMQCLNRDDLLTASSINPYCCALV